MGTAVRPPRTAWGLLAAAAALGSGTVLLAHGLAAEYADTGAPSLAVARSAVGDWWVPLAVVGVLAAGAGLSARAAGVWAAAAALLAVAVVGVGAGAAVGAAQKYARYPVVPDCVGEFDGGPAQPVVEAAQRGFEEIDHPGPFSGGGSSGVDGCSTQLMVRPGVEPVEHYLEALPAAGWRVVADTGRTLRAVDDGRAFELEADGDGWWVWIGPRARRDRPAGEGLVGLTGS
jgi:hypothetical protein